MKLSIKQILTIRQRDFYFLNRAFHEALGDKYEDPEYSLTQEDAQKVANELVRLEQDAGQDGVFPLSSEQKWQNVQEANLAGEAFRDLYYNFLKP